VKSEEFVVIKFQTGIWLLSFRFIVKLYEAELSSSFKYQKFVAYISLLL